MNYLIPNGRPCVINNEQVGINSPLGRMNANCQWKAGTGTGCSRSYLLKAGKNQAVPGSAARRSPRSQAQHCREKGRRNGATRVNLQQRDLKADNRTRASPPRGGCSHSKTRHRQDEAEHSTSRETVEENPPGSGTRVYMNGHRASGLGRVWNLNHQELQTRKSFE